MGIVMNMDSYEIEYDSTENEYGEEILSSGWNPSVTLVCPALSLQSAWTGEYGVGCRGLYPNPVASQKTNIG